MPTTTYYPRPKLLLRYAVHGSPNEMRERFARWPDHRQVKCSLKSVLLLSCPVIGRHPSKNMSLWSHRLSRHWNHSHRFGWCYSAFAPFMVDIKRGIRTPQAWLSRPRARARSSTQIISAAAAAVLWTTRTSPNSCPCEFTVFPRQCNSASLIVPLLSSGPGWCYSVCFFLPLSWLDV